MIFAECEIVAEAALQLGCLRDELNDGAELSDARLVMVRNGMSKIIGLLSALPLEAEDKAVLPVEAIAKLEFAKVEVCPECGGTELSGHQARCSRG